MISLTVLIAAVAACSLARPPGEIRPEAVHIQILSSVRFPRVQQVVGPYALPHHVVPRYPIFVDPPLVTLDDVIPLDRDRPRHEYDWLKQEMERISSSTYDEGPYSEDDSREGRLPLSDTFGPSILLDDSPPAPEDMIPANHLPNKVNPYQGLVYANEEYAKNAFPQNEISASYEQGNLPSQYEDFAIFRSYHEEGELTPVIEEVQIPPAHDKGPVKDATEELPFLNAMTREHETNVTNQTSNLADDMKRPPYFLERDENPKLLKESRIPPAHDQGPVKNAIEEWPFFNAMTREHETNVTNQTSNLADDMKRPPYFLERDENPKQNISETPSSMAKKNKAPQYEPGVFEPRRQTRQNPLYSKNRNLYAGDLETLKSGVASNNLPLTMSLLPSNLHFLRKPPKGVPNNDESAHDGSSGEDLHPIPLTSGGDNPTESIYWVTFIAIVGGTFTFAVFGFAFGWYLMMTKEAKLAADVDYPGYGVTGPCTDLTGDRKLAHSAHMYHYQHQKQQIIAMGRDDSERNGSITDPDSDEENEEGDYTVYECPGFASTGNMEVKNPMFTAKPTPMAPGKIEIFKPQPKE